MFIVIVVQPILRTSCAPCQIGHACSCNQRVEWVSKCDLPQSLHEQVALSLLSEAAQELLARQLLAVHCELRQYGGNKEALNWLTQMTMNFLNLDNTNRFSSGKSEAFLHIRQSVEWKIMITTMSLHSKQVNNFKLEFSNLKRHSFPKA